MGWVVAAYELDRHYGGPEEGGWWYNSGELRRVLKVCHREDEAYRLARRLNKIIGKMQEGRPNIYSMAYQGGQIGIEVYRYKAPEFYPEERPHYE